MRPNSLCVLTVAFVSFLASQATAEPRTIAAEVRFESNSYRLTRTEKLKLEIFATKVARDIENDIIDIEKIVIQAKDKVPQLWLYADNDRLYDEALIRGYYEAFTAAGGKARFELLHGVPGDGHLLRLFPERWQKIADEFLATLGLKIP